MYPLAPSIPLLSVGRWTHFGKIAELCGGYSEALLGLEAGHLSLPYSPHKGY